MGWFSDFFVASDEELTQLGAFSGNPYETDIWNLPVRPALRTSGLDDWRRVSWLIGQLADWTAEEVESQSQTVAEARGELSVIRLPTLLADALAAADAGSVLADKVTTSPDWAGARHPWSDPQHLQTFFSELRALARRSIETGGHLWWWRVDSELLK